MVLSRSSVRSGARSTSSVQRRRSTTGARSARAHSCWRHFSEGLADRASSAAEAARATLTFKGALHPRRRHSPHQVQRREELWIRHLQSRGERALGVKRCSRRGRRQESGIANVQVCNSSFEVPKVHASVDPKPLAQMPPIRFGETPFFSFPAQKWRRSDLLSATPPWPRRPPRRLPQQSCSRHRPSYHRRRHRPSYHRRRARRGCQLPTHLPPRPRSPCRPRRAAAHSLHPRRQHPGARPLRHHPSSRRDRRLHPSLPRCLRFLGRCSPLRCARTRLGG